MPFFDALTATIEERAYEDLPGESDCIAKTGRLEVNGETCGLHQLMIRENRSTNV